MVCVDARVAKVVGGSVCSIDHVGREEELRLCEMGCVRPDMEGASAVKVELKSPASPVPNDRALGVVCQRVFLVNAAHKAVVVLPLAEPGGSAPYVVYGVPTCEADTRGQVGHGQSHVVDAFFGEDPGPAWELPMLGELGPDFLVGVVCRVVSEVFVNVSLGAGLPSVVVFPCEGKG